VARWRVDRCNVWKSREGGHLEHILRVGEERGLAER
jgi:hypothetical protein